MDAQSIIVYIIMVAAAVWIICVIRRKVKSRNLPDCHSCTDTDCPLRDLKNRKDCR